MTQSENIHDMIKRLYGKIPKKIKVLEAQIDVDLQISYYEISQKFRNDKSKIRDFEVLKNILNDENTLIEEKKAILAEMANIADVKAYREIEKLSETAGDELKDWVYLALNESRMSVESFLLDEEQIIVSSGLGGKGDKLRYFAVFSTQGEEDFTEVQKKIVEKELNFTFEKHDGLIENVQFHENFCMVTALLPIVATMEEIIPAVINDCNQLGEFVSYNIIISNTDILTVEQVKETWGKIVNKD